MSVQKDHKGFQASRYTIKVKLIGIISLVILTALSGATFFASAFFSEVSRDAVQDNNQDLAHATVAWTESELRYIQNETLSLLPSLSQKDAGRLFQKNPEFLYLGLSPNGRTFPKQAYNRSLMLSENISASAIQQINQQNKKVIASAVPGLFRLYNASTGGKHALLGLSQKVSGGFLVLYMDPERILRGFEIKKSTRVFVVNEKGDVILHPDPRVVLARSNFIKKKVVKQMWQASVTTGQTRYEDEGDGKTYLASYRKFSYGNYGLIAQVDTDIVFSPARRIRNRNLIVMGIFLLIAIMFVYLFAKLISGPVISLVRAANQVKEGKYDLNMRPRSKDEIGLLTYAFNDMARGLGEREKMKDAFGKFVNKEIAEQVLRGDLKLGGEKKKAAIFFSDLRGFTALSEGLEPEAVVKFLNAYFTDMVRCVHETHGVVDKYIGDAIMAHWGAIGGKGNHTENAINAGLLMRKALLAFNEVHKGRFPTAKMGSGINTGPLISGQIGSEERLEYTVIGDAVNLASRIEALNKPFGTDLLISEDACREVEGIFKLTPMPAIKVKGKAEPQKIYAVLGRKDDPQCPADLAELRKILEIKIKEEATAEDAEAKEEKFEIVKQSRWPSQRVLIFKPLFF